MTKDKQSIDGFTFVELMITLTIIAVLSATLVPTFNDILQDSKLITQVNKLQASLSFARSEAIKRNNYITLCRSNDGISCGGDWTKGWIVFVDDDFDNTVDTDELILLVRGPVMSGNTVSFNRSRVTYTGEGWARGGSNGTFTFCDNRGQTHARAVIISNSGRGRLAVDRNANGIVENGSNTNISCP
jgi:type IV fimbrial biogenesis protein FimT